MDASAFSSSSPLPPPHPNAFRILLARTHSMLSHNDDGGNNDEERSDFNSFRLSVVVLRKSEQFPPTCTCRFVVMCTPNITL